MKTTLDKFNFSENVIINLCIFGLLWLSLLYFGAPAASNHLDPSWIQALGYAFKNNYQAGIDYILTFGPLGYFYHIFSSYDSDLFNKFVAWHILSSLFLSALFVIMSSRINGKITKFIYFFLLIVITSSFSPDAIYYLGIIAAVILAITTLPRFKNNLGQLALFLGIILWFLAIIYLTKFTNFILINVGILAITAMIWHIYSLRFAIVIPSTFVIFLMATWFICGQSLLTFPLFIAHSLQISSGYSEAMSKGFELTEITLAIVCINIAILMMFWWCVTKPLKFERFVISGLIAFGWFLTWKAGFVRHDLHSVIFFNFALIAPFFLDDHHNLKPGLLFIYRFLRYIAVITALIGLFVAVGNPLSYKPNNFLVRWNNRIVSNLSTLFNLQEFKKNQDQHVITLKQQHDLPQIRTQVGQATVDIFSWEQGVLFLNELNWHPRPVFQSYTAYTPSLIALNGNFYASDQAPEFVIFKLQAIDGQFPFMNDIEALKIVLRDYQPILSEKGYLLLKRVPRGQGLVSEGKILLAQSIKIGEQFDIHTLSHEPLLLSLNIRKSLLGKLSSLFYKFPPIFIEITTLDGTQMSYRIIPNMVKSGFVINPLILSQTDLKAWYQEMPLKRVATLRLVVKPEWVLPFFKTNIDVTVSEFEVIPYPIDEKIKHKI